MQWVCLHSLTIRHLSHLFLSFSLCLSLCVHIVMANCYILPVYSFTCVSFLPSLLYLFCPPLVLSVSVIFLRPLSLCRSPLLLFSLLHFFCLHLSLYIFLSLHLHSPFSFPHLFSPPLPSLLPLFRLCKVQLGFGAFGLQAWRQEDALSEYALLGSLCVTLYFFALLFLPVVLTYFISFLLLLYLSSHGRPVFPWVSFFDGGRPSSSDIASVLQKTGVPKTVSFSGISRKHLFTQVKLAAACRIILLYPFTPFSLQ